MKNTITIEGATRSILQTIRHLNYKLYWAKGPLGTKSKIKNKAQIEWESVKKHHLPYSFMVQSLIMTWKMHNGLKYLEYDLLQYECNQFKFIQVIIRK